MRQQKIIEILFHYLVRDIVIQALAPDRVEEDVKRMMVDLEFYRHFIPTFYISYKGHYLGYIDTDFIEDSKIVSLEFSQNDSPT